LDHNDADLEMSDSCVRNSLLSWVIPVRACYQLS